MSLQMLGAPYSEEPTSIDQPSVFMDGFLRDVSNLESLFYMDELTMSQDHQASLGMMPGVEAGLFSSPYMLSQQQQQLGHLQPYHQPQQPHQPFFDPYHLSSYPQSFTSSSEMPSTLQPLPFQPTNAYPQMADPAPISSPMATSPMATSPMATSPMGYTASSPGPLCPPSPDAYPTMAVYPSPYGSPISTGYASPNLTGYSIARAETPARANGTRRKNTRSSPYQLSTSFKSRAKQPKGRSRNVPDMPENRETFQCDKCPKQFDRRYNFVQHHKTHSEVKEYRCDFQGCDSAFHRKADMQRHRLRHTGELPIKCHFCDARFRRVEAQKRHCQQEHREAYSCYLEEKRQLKDLRAMKKGHAARC